MTPHLPFQIRNIQADDVAAVAQIDAAHTAETRPDLWQNLIARHLMAGRRGSERVGLVAVSLPEQTVIGYVFGQVRAFEFGSEPCGWIYAIGVQPDSLHRGVATHLFQEARVCFAQFDISLVRTMVRRNDIPVLTFFRNQGFVAGPFVELELSIDEEASQ